MRYRVLPYRQGSKGAKALATALGGKVLKLEGSSFVPKSNDVIINWGNTRPTSEVFPNWYTQQEGQEAHWLNGTALIKSASNKLEFFKLMAAADLGNLIPEFWTNAQDIPDTAFPVVCRTVLAGHSGAGIVIADTRGELVHAPLYVRYVKKQDEYRVHVGKRGENTGYVMLMLHSPYSEGDPYAEIISVQRKARRHDCPNPNWLVRNHQNGFVYVRQDVNPPPTVIEVAKKAFMETGLDFGAVDVIYNSQKGRAYVLEINTAPGLEGTTVEDYKNFFQSI